ncbi:MAG TPA: O-antigen ligase family protein [Blastocatellia bacterium]|nr:O-antigen ligase family protein [Blastocatellia bacterium]
MATSNLRTTEWLYLALITTLPILSLSVVAQRATNVALSDLFFVAAFGCWMLDFLKGHAKLRRSWFYLPLALYLVAVICSALLSINPLQSAVKLLGKIYLIALAVMTFNLVTTLAFFRRVAEAWLIGTTVTVIVCLLAIAMFYAGFGESTKYLSYDYASLPVGNYPRVRGLSGFPALLCNYLNISLMIVIAMRLAGWLSARWFWLLITGICISALFSFSPGLGGVYLSAGLSVWLWLRSRKYERGARLVLAGSIALAIAIFLSAAVLLFDRVPQGIYSPLLQGQLRPSARALLWHGAFQTFTQHPIFGNGVGTKVANVRFIVPSGKEHVLSDAHNTLLSIAAETGLFGLLSFAAVIVFLLRKQLPLSFSNGLDQTIRTCFVIALIGALFYQSLTGSFEDSRHLWILFGLIVSASQAWADDVSREKVIE